MAQIGVDIGSYEFNAIAKTITFTGVTITDITQIKPIVNGTKGVVIFNPAVLGLFGTLSNNVLTLESGTAGQEDTDKLYICVNDGINQTEINQKELNINNKELLTLIFEELQQQTKLLKKIYQ